MINSSEVAVFSEREQAQFEHVQYVHRQLMVAKSTKREPLAIFIIIGGLIYYGTQVLAVAIAIAWIAAMLRGLADDLKRTYLLTEFNRAMCEFEGDLEALKLKLGIDRDLKIIAKKTFWQNW
jgi:hypothetical protein